MLYEAEFTLEGGAELNAEDHKEASEKAYKEAVRQYGKSIADEMTIHVFKLHNNNADDLDEKF